MTGQERGVFGSIVVLFYRGIWLGLVVKCQPTLQALAAVRVDEGRRSKLYCIRLVSSGTQRITCTYTDAARPRTGRSTIWTVFSHVATGTRMR